MKQKRRQSESSSSVIKNKQHNEQKNQNQEEIIFDKEQDLSLIKGRKYDLDEDGITDYVSMSFS